MKPLAGAPGMAPTAATIRTGSGLPSRPTPWNSVPRPPIIDFGASAGNGYGRLTEMIVGAAFIPDEVSKVQGRRAARACRTSGGLNGAAAFHAAVLVSRLDLADVQPELTCSASAAIVRLP